jgi:hypothetical protein
MAVAPVSTLWAGPLLSQIYSRIRRMPMARLALIYEMPPRCRPAPCELRDDLSPDLPRIDRTFDRRSEPLLVRRSLGDQLLYERIVAGITIGSQWDPGGCRGPILCEEGFPTPGMLVDLMA